MLKEALLYNKQVGGRVQCQLCAHRCSIDDGQMGSCHVRENRGGTLYTLVYGRTTNQHVDPVEKKPLFHFYPGSNAYSIATLGCNLHCQYCTNWEVSQISPGQFDGANVAASPSQVIDAALRSNCHSVAFTYVEPTIFFEYAHEIAQLAHAKGLFNIYKTNGFMTNEMLALSHSYLDAANVDLKTFRDHTYLRFGGRLQPVLDCLKRMRSFNIWLEVTTVIIPGLTDDPVELKDCATFIARELGADTPWHVTRFFPAYQMKHIPPTPIASLYQAREIGIQAGLNYVYLGNLLESGKQDTNCVNCGQVLIRRHGSRLLENRVRHGNCPNCGSRLPGIGLSHSADAECNVPYSK